MNSFLHPSPLHVAGFSLRSVGQLVASSTIVEFIGTPRDSARSSPGNVPHSSHDEHVSLTLTLPKEARSDVPSTARDTVEREAVIPLIPRAPMYENLPSPLARATPIQQFSSISGDNSPRDRSREHPEPLTYGALSSGSVHDAAMMYLRGAPVDHCLLILQVCLNLYYYPIGEL